MRSKALPSCPKCNKVGCFTPHGFLYPAGRESSAPMGKRIICNKSPLYGGCGVTLRLLPVSAAHRRHQPLSAISTFVQRLMEGVSIAMAYILATGSNDPRQGQRWWEALLRKQPDLRADLLKRNVEVLEETPKDDPPSQKTMEKLINPAARSENLRKTLRSWWSSAKLASCPLQSFQLQHQTRFL